MDASRLLEVLVDIDGEFKRGYAEQIEVIVGAYTKALENPNQDFSEQVSAAHKQFSNFVEESAMNDYPPSKRRIIEAIGGAVVVGRAADLELHNRLSVVGVTGAALVT